MFKRASRHRDNQQKSKLINQAIRRSAAIGCELLEARWMMSTDFLLNGTQLTQIVNGSPQTPTTVGSSVTMTGSDNMTVENFSGTVSINGGGGGDTITVYGGSGGTISITDPTAVTLDQVVVRAPTTTATNLTATASQVTLGTGDTISYGTGVGAVSLAGQLFSNGDALAVTGSGGNTITVGASSVGLGASGAPTIYYSTFNGLSVNGGASDNFTLAGDSIPTTLNAGSGNVAFNVQTNSVALGLVGGAGTDTYTINSNSGQLTATGGSGNSAFTVNGSSSSMTLNGGAGTNSFTVQSNSASLNINGGGTANTVTVNGNSSTITARGGSGSADSYTVNSTTGQVGITGGTGSSTYLISAPTVAAVNITGNTSGTGSALTFDGTALNNAFSITTNAVSAGSGAAVGFSHLTSLTVNGIGGNDSFLVNSDTVPTTINGAAGNDTFNLQSESGGLTVATGTGVSTVNLGSNAPLTTNNTISGLSGAVTVTGDNSDTLNLNNVADSTARIATLTSASLIGLNFGGLTYSGLATLNVKLGSGGNTVAVNSTAAATVTNFNTGAGSNTVYLGSTSSGALGGVLANVAGTLNLTGPGADALLLDDSGDASSKTATLTATSLTGLSPAAITYTGASALTVDLGTAGNTFSITNTHTGTSTTVNGGAGNDTLKIVADSSPVSLTTGGGSDTVLVQSIGAATSVSSTGNSTIDVGSLAPATGGMLSGIAGGLTITGTSTDTLNADDTGDTSAATGTLSASALHGLGTGTSGIAYTGLGHLNLGLGSGGDTFTVTNTEAGTATNITSGSGADTINLDANSSLTTISSGAGNDHVNVQSLTTAATINTGIGMDVVYVGNNAPATPSTTTTVAAGLIIAGGGNTTLDLDDTGDSAAESPVITNTSVTGISGGISGNGVGYSGLSALNVTLGTGGNAVSVNSTASTVITSINTGAGNDTTNIFSTGGVTNINDGAGTNVVNVGSNAPSEGSVTSNILGALNITGSASAYETLNLLDAYDALPRVATLTATTMTGISPAAISYTGFSDFSVYMGSGNSSLTVSNTFTGNTEINTGSGNDSITLKHDSGNTEFRGGNSTYAIQNVTATTDIYALAADAITVGNPVSGGRSLTGIAAPVILYGNSTGSTALVDDSGDTVARTGTLSAGAITGLSAGAIDYSNLASLNLNLGSGGNTLGVTGTSTPTTIAGGNGADVVNVQADEATLNINPGGGTNTTNIGSNAPATGGTLTGISSVVTVTSTGTDTLNIDDSGDTTVRSAGYLDGFGVSGLGGAAIDYSGQTALNLTLGNAADTLNIPGTLALSTHVATGNAGSTVNITGNLHPLTIVSGAADLVNVGVNDPVDSLTGLAALVTITGNGHDTLNVNDNNDLSNTTGALSATHFSGLGSAAGINYTGVSQFNVNLSQGNDSFTVTGTSAVTAVTGTGTNTIAVTGTSNATTLTSPGTILIGSSTASGGTVAGLIGPITVTGNGGDQMLVEDLSDTTARTGTLSSTQLTLGPATVSYSGLASTVVNLGSGGDSFTVNNTAAATPVTINGGTGTDTLNIGGNSSTTTINDGSATSVINVGNSSNIIDGLTAPLTVTGTGTNTLNVNDTGSTIAKTGSLSSTTITGLNTAGITYTGMSQLNLLLGSGGNTLGVTNTAVATVTNINSGSGADTVNIANTGGTTNLSTGAGNNTVNVAGTGGTTNITDGSGNDTVNVGSNAPATSSVTSNISGALNVTGNATSTDTINLLDASDATARTVTLNPASITGISPATISYTGFADVNLDMGTAASTLNVTGTIAGQTDINTSTGADTITLQQTNGLTQLQAGGSTIAVQHISAATEIDSLTANQITVGNPVTGGRTLAGINATLTLDGATGSSATIDDSADPVVHTAALTSTALTGLSTGAIDYSSLASLHVLLGTSTETLTVASTASGTPTTIAGGSGSDTLNIQTDSSPLSLAGVSTINIGSAAPASGGVLSGLANPVSVSGVGHLNLDDSGDSTVRAGETLSATSVSGFGGAGINYIGVNALNLTLGNAADTLTVASTATGTTNTVHTGTAGSVLDVQSVSSGLTISSNAADTVNIGSAAPASSTLSSIAATVTVTGDGDTLNALDNADTTATAGALGSSAITGLGMTGEIAYNGVSNLNLSLGSGNDSFTVNGTSAQTAITGSGENAIGVTGTTTPLSITSPGAISVGSNVGSLTGPISITGDGSDQLTFSDTSDTVSRTGSLSSTVWAVGPASVSYTGAASLAVSLGSGGDQFTVNSTAAATSVTVTGGSGTDTLNIGADSSSTTIIAGSAHSSINVGHAGVVDGLTAPLTIQGTGTNPLHINDSASTIAKSGSLTTTELTGLNTAGIQYTGMGSATVALGSGGNNFNVISLNTPTTLTAGSGGDHLLLSGTDDTTNELAAPLDVVGAGNAAVTVNDTGSTTGKTMTLTSTTVSGLSPAPVTYASLGALNIELGSGHDTVDVNGTGTATGIIGNNVGQSFDVTPGSLTGPLMLSGAGSDALTYDDSADTTGRAITFAIGEITGVSSPVHYTGMSTLTAKLGVGNDTATITSVDPSVPTSIDGGPGTNVAIVNITGDLAGHLTLSEFQSGTLNVSGNLTGQLLTDGGFSNTTVDGDVTGILAAAGTLASVNVGGNLADTISAGAGMGTVDVAGDLTGTLSTPANISNITIDGNLSGTVAVSGDVTTLHIEGSFQPSGTLDVTGTLQELEVDGADAGQSNVGALEGVIEKNIAPASDGTIFSLTQGGVTRSILALANDESTGFAGTTFSIVYDSSTGTPQAAVRVNGGTAGERFDLVLNSTAGTVFDLSRLDSAGDAATQVRNVAIDGSLLGAVTTDEANFFGYSPQAPGGVQLPADHLAAVSARDVMANESILAASIQGIGYAQLSGTQGEAHPGGRISVSQFKEKLLFSTLAVSPTTHKPIAAIKAPTETLLVPAGTIANKTGLYAGSGGGLILDTNGLIVWDHDADQSALASVTFSTKRVNGELTANLLAWQGTGGSVQSLRVVSNITSTGALGDVLLGAGKGQILDSITAPSIEGTIDLYTGKLLGTIQTTSGDLGSSDGSTSIALTMAPGSQIISRGDLFSHVAVTGNFAGTIAANGDITGDISVSGKGRSTGSLIAFGAITGSVSVAGSFSGQVAAGGSNGIQGNVSLNKGLAAGGSVISNGVIGNSAAGTALTAQSVRGLIVASGSVQLRTLHPNSSNPVVQNSGGTVEGSGASAELASLWGTSGQPLQIDESPEDLAGLAQIKARLKSFYTRLTGSRT